MLRVRIFFKCTLILTLSKCNLHLLDPFNRS